MNIFTLKLRSNDEAIFWATWSQQLIWVDIVSVFMSCITVIMVMLDVKGYFKWDLALYHPMFTTYCYILLALRLVQFALLMASRTLYWRVRVFLVILIKAFIGHFMLDALLTAGVNRPGFYRYEWLGKGVGNVTKATVIRALLVPSGAVGALFEVFQYVLPFRYSLPLQLWETITAVRVGWAPVTALIGRNEQLSAGVKIICETISETIAFLSGLGITWHDTSDTTKCATEVAASGTVLLSQLLFVLVIPLMMIYLVECEAKVLYLARLQQRRMFHHARYRLHWLFSPLILLVLIMVCHSIVDLVHWLDLAPPV